MEILILYSILSSALFYLGSRAKITEPVWSSYPAWLAKFADCSACSGFWYGIGLAATLGRYDDLSFLGCDAQDPITPIVIGACMIVLTPIVAGLMQNGIGQVGSALPEEAYEPGGK